MKRDSQPEKPNTAETRRRGRPANPENAKRCPLLVRLPKDIYDELQRAALATDAYMGDIVTDLVRKWLATLSGRQAGRAGGRHGT